MSKELRDDLIRDEGLKLSAYLDTNGFWTIGVGHLLGPKTTKFSGPGMFDPPRMIDITKEEALALLEADVQIAMKSLNAVFGEPLAQYVAWLTEHTSVRYRALVNMAFNRGETHMRESTTITPAIKVALGGDVDYDIAWKKVGDAIRVSPWAKQIGKRAERLAHMLEMGTEA